MATTIVKTPLAGSGEQLTASRVLIPPNKSTSEIRTLAQEYGEEAIRRLVTLMRQRDDRKVQFAAARELLYRGYGRPTEVAESAEDIYGLRELAERMENGRLRVAAGQAEKAWSVIRPSDDLQIVSKP